MKHDSKTWAFLSTFLSIVGFILALLMKKDDDYVMFYAKQSLIVFIFAIIGSVVAAVPFIGWIISGIIGILVIILWLFSWVYALSGHKKEVPVIGGLANDWFKNL
ncbi:DUF4870 domain-containing protein [Candidatus Woesearchaeota archaeon]|nr:DUF4870 domain-containing protein [Candidatus Woesearchaeota archaeon]